MCKLIDRLETVKYLAYLRKMTRYNPTRGGKAKNILLHLHSS